VAGKNVLKLLFAASHPPKAPLLLEKKKATGSAAFSLI
jgi:hypothetical protein